MHVCALESTAWLSPNSIRASVGVACARRRESRYFLKYPPFVCKAVRYCSSLARSTSSARDFSVPHLGGAAAGQSSELRTSLRGWHSGERRAGGGRNPSEGSAPQRSRYADPLLAPARGRRGGPRPLRGSPRRGTSGGGCVVPPRLSSSLRSR